MFMSNMFSLFSVPSHCYCLSDTDFVSSHSFVSGSRERQCFSWRGRQNGWHKERQGNSWTVKRTETRRSTRAKRKELKRRLRRKRRQRRQREVRNSHESSPFSLETPLLLLPSLFVTLGVNCIFLLFSFSSFLSLSSLTSEKREFCSRFSLKTDDTQDLLLFFLSSFLSQDIPLDFNFCLLLLHVTFCFLPLKWTRTTGTRDTHFPSSINALPSPPFHARLRRWLESEKMKREERNWREKRHDHQIYWISFKNQTRDEKRDPMRQSIDCLKSLMDSRETHREKVE